MFSTAITQKFGRLLAQAYLFAVLAAVVQLFTAISPAQSTYGEFVGTVKDPSGAVVAGSAITVKNLGTGGARTATTDSTGSFTVVNLEPGNYEMTVEMTGFQKVTHTNLQLLSRQTMRIDTAMALSSQAQTVEVNVQAEAPINTEVSNIAETKLGRELIDLPVALGSRAAGSTSAFSTLTTQPGVEVDNNNNISVAGGKIDMLSMSVDGISTMSVRDSAPVAELFPSFDGIAEIRVSEINNTAEFGGISDVTTVSKGGGNQYHGGVFENHQNSAFAARDTFSATVPKVIMNDFGAFFGGPISIPKLYSGKDRTFFFMTYEGLRLPGQQVLVESVPSVPLRNGDLSVYPVVRDLNGTPFPNKFIPESSRSAVSMNVLKYLFPLPNTGTVNQISNNYVQNFPTPKTSNQGDMRIDQNITSKQSAFARFTYKRRIIQLPPCGSFSGTCSSNLNGSAIAGPNLVPENDWNLTGAYNYVIGAHLVNEFRTGWTGSNAALSTGIPASTIAQQVGIAPYLSQNLSGVSAAPDIRIAGFQRTGGIGSNIHRTQTYQFLDNLTWTQGKHTVKFGADYRYLKALYTSVFDTLWQGRYKFTNSSATNPIGNAFGAFLQGVPDSDTLATVLSPDTNAYGSAYALYAQDDWKVTPRLTINYGLRWEYHPMMQDHNGNVAAFLPDLTTTVNGQTVHGGVAVPNESLKLVNPAFAQSIAPTPILTANQAGIPNSLRYSQKTDFAPRVGFAWRVTNDGKTVIRGGYGRFVEAPLGFLILSSWAVEASDVATFTNSISGGKAQLRFPYAFPSNLAQPGTQDFDLSYALHYKDPYVQQWNLTIERDLGFQTGLRLSYDGSHGTDLDLTTNPDQVHANTIGFDKASASAPYPLWDSLVNVQNGGRSNYNAFTATVNKRMSKGLQLQASYRFAKNLSNSGGYNPTSFGGAGGGQTSDFFNPNLDYGNVPFTRRNRFQSTFLYETFSHSSNKIVSQVLGGWEIAGVLMFQSGPFLTVTAPGSDPSGTNFTNSFNAAGDPRADVVSGTSLYPQNQSINNWVNQAAFVIPKDNIGRFGNSPVGNVVGPGTQAVSLSIYRSFKYKERLALRIGASSTNLFNHPNYGIPNLQVGTDPFGTISNLQNAEGSGPRAIQLGGRFTF
jgi:hypothetical protein